MLLLLLVLRLAGAERNPDAVSSGTARKLRDCLFIGKESHLEAAAAAAESSGLIGESAAAAATFAAADALAPAAVFAAAAASGEAAGVVCSSRELSLRVEKNGCHAAANEDSDASAADKKLL